MVDEKLIAGQQLQHLTVQARIARGDDLIA